MKFISLLILVFFSQYTMAQDTVSPVVTVKQLFELTEANAKQLDISHQNFAITVTARNGIAISDANIEEVKARFENAEVNYQRYANLLKEDVVTKFQFD